LFVKLLLFDFTLRCGVFVTERLHDICF